MSALASGESAPPQLRPLALGEVLDVGMKIAWRNAGTLIRVVVVVVLPVEILSAFIQLSAMPAGTTFQGGSTFAPNLGQANELALSRSQVETLFAGVAAAAILGALAGIVASGACYRAIASAYLGEPTNWRDSLKYALRRFHSILWVTLLTGLIAGLGLLLCIIPGIYLGIAFAVGIPVLMTENVRGLKALRRSRFLVGGFWWRTLGVVVLGTILTSIIAAVLGGLALAFISSGSSTTTWVVASTASNTISRVVTTPFTAAFVTILYFDLRVRKEAFDLQLIASRIGVDPPEGWISPAPVAASGSTPPYWPPPPGWQPTPSTEPGPGLPPPFDPPTDQPPFWPPPPGWRPGGSND